MNKDNDDIFMERVFKFEDWLMECLLAETDKEKRIIYKEILKEAIEILE